MKRSPQSATSAKGPRCCFTLPRCRCRPGPSATPPGSSAVTAGDRLALAEAHSGPAGPAGAGLPAQGETFAELAAGFGAGTATAWRYVTETVALLAARSPKLRRALAGAKDAGHAYVVIDGTLIAIDRVAADRPSAPASTATTA